MLIVKSRIRANKDYNAALSIDYKASERKNVLGRLFFARLETD